MKKEIIKHHATLFIKGFARMLFGTLTAGLLGLSVYGFSAIPKEGGYIAVADFIVASLTLACALSCIYAMGGRGKKSRFSA